MQFLKLKLNSKKKKRQRHNFADKGLCSQSCGFSSGHVQMWELDHKTWALKNWWFQILVLEKTLESFLDCRGIKPVNPKGFNPEHSLEGLILKLKLQYFGHLMWELTHWKRPWCWERTWKQKEEKMAEDETVRWYHWFNGLDFEQTPEEEPGELKSMRSQRVRNNLATEQQDQISSVQSLSHVQLFATAAHQTSLWHHQLMEPAQTHVCWVSDGIQPSHPLSSLDPPAFNFSHHQGLFQWVSSSHQVAKVLELQHQSFQWIYRTD